MRKLFIFSLLLIAISGINAQNRKLRANLLDKNNHSVMVVSHRGDWRNAPENSLQAIQNCIDMGVDMVEVDLKKTKDGHLIVMHDQTIDRTTTGKGKRLPVLVMGIKLSTILYIWAVRGWRYGIQKKICRRL